jgi:hypothetical protein
LAVLVDDYVPAIWTKMASTVMKKGEDKKLCDVCQKRPATYHTCYGNTGETRDLCMTCFKETASPEELEAYHQSRHMLRNAKCKYCGAPAVQSSMSCGEAGVIEEKNEFWCQLCLLDLAEFATRSENAIPDDFDIENEAKMKEISQQLADRTRRQDEFMRQRVRARLQ